MAQTREDWLVGSNLNGLLHLRSTGGVMTSRWIRTIIVVLEPLALISMVVESFEFGLVALLNGAPVTEPEVYFRIRNQGWFLGLKLVYNTAAAAAGGFLAARIAVFAPFRHAAGLAVVQTLAFAWVLSQPDLSRWTRGWVWSALIVLSVAGIASGAAVATIRSGSAWRSGGEGQ